MLIGLSNKYLSSPLPNTLNGAITQILSKHPRKKKSMICSEQSKNMLDSLTNPRFQGQAPVSVWSRSCLSAPWWLLIPVGRVSTNRDGWYSTLRCSGPLFLLTRELSWGIQGVVWDKQKCKWNIKVNCGKEKVLNGTVGWLEADSSMGTHYTFIYSYR